MSGGHQHLEEKVKGCSDCQAVRNRPPTTLLHPWTWPDAPWKRIHIDFAGPVSNSMFLVVTDSHSKWLEVIPMASTTSEKTLEVLRNLFAAYGLPEQLVSDNGPQFTSVEFEECMNAMELNTSRYHRITRHQTELLRGVFRFSSRL